jgi:hypothetical protein
MTGCTSAVGRGENSDGIGNCRHNEADTFHGKDVQIQSVSWKQSMKMAIHGETADEDAAKIQAHFARG